MRYGYKIKRYFFLPFCVDKKEAMSRNEQTDRGSWFVLFPFGLTQKEQKVKAEPFRFENYRSLGYRAQTRLRHLRRAALADGCGSTRPRWPPASFVFLLRIAKAFVERCAFLLGCRAWEGKKRQ